MTERQPSRAPFSVDSQSDQSHSAETQRTASDLATSLLAANGFAGCLICVAERGRGQLSLLASSGRVGATTCACDQQGDPGLDAALNGKPSAWSQSTGEPPPQFCPPLGEQQFGGRLLLPLNWRQRSLGVIQLFREGSEPFGDEEVSHLARYATAAAAALENARLYDRAQVLFSLAQTVSSTLDLQQVGDLIAEKVTKAMGAKGCTVRSLERLSSQLQLVGAYGLSHKYLFEKGPVLASASIRDALDGKPTAIFDVAHDERAQYPAAAIEEGIGSIASVPMVVKGVVTGVLRVYTSKPHEFQPDEMAFLCAAAGVAAAAVENARLYDGIRHDFDTLMDEIIFVRRAARAVGGKEAGV